MGSLWTLYLPILIQSLSAFALLLTVYYSHKQYKEMQKQTEALQKQVEELQKKPDLKVELNPTLFDSVHPYFNKNSTSLPVEAINGERDVRYIKLDVCNKGKATAKECSAKVEIIEKEPPNRVIKSIFLTWDTGGDHELIDIPVNDCEMAVLMKIIREYNARKPMYDSLHIGMTDTVPFYTSFYTYSHITNKEDWAHGKNTMLKITVYCENATPKHVCITFKKSPTFDEITNSNDIREFFDFYDDNSCLQSTKLA